MRQEAWATMVLALVDFGSEGFWDLAISDGQSSTAATFAGDQSDGRNLESSHFAEIHCNSLALTPLLRSESGISSGNIDETDNRALEFFCQLHTPQSLAVSLRIGHAKVALH